MARIMQKNYAEPEAFGARKPPQAADPATFLQSPPPASRSGKIYFNNSWLGILTRINIRIYSLVASPTCHLFKQFRRNWSTTFWVLLTQKHTAAKNITKKKLIVASSSLAAFVIYMYDEQCALRVTSSALLLHHVSKTPFYFFWITLKKFSNTTS